MGTKSYYRQYAREHTFQAYTNMARAIERRKRACFEMLGGAACAHCGYDKDRRALCFDHIHGNGRQEKRELNLTTNILKYYSYILAHPEKFQVLCMNCNQIKKYENNEGHGYNSRRNKPEAVKAAKEPSPQLGLLN